MDAIRFVEPLTFDADSGKDGRGIVRTLTGDHNDRVTDMTALILEPIVLESNQNHEPIVCYKPIAIGADLYNQNLTGTVAKTLNSRATDSDHIPCVIEVIGADIYNLALTGDKACSLTSEGWTSTGTCPKVLILDHHPNDSRTGIAEDQQAVQTLTSRMGTGGGNVPLIAEPITYDAQVTNPLHKDNTEGGSATH